MNPDERAVMSRRAFLARAAVVGMAGASIGALLEACRGQTPPSPQPGTSPLLSFATASSIIEPPPTTASYGELLEFDALVAEAAPTDSLALLSEVASDAGIPLDPIALRGRRQGRVRVAVDGAGLPPQGYRLEVSPGSDGPTIAIRAADPAGAYYALLSMAQLAVAEGPRHAIRVASVEDAPAFERRGAILDPYVLPDVGVTAASRALLLERLKLGVRWKLNFVDLPDRAPWPELVAYCIDHHIELMIAKGYRDSLSVTQRQVIKDAIAADLDAGARSFSLCWDDIATTQPETLARSHAAVFQDLYDFVRGRVPDARVSAVLPPYGGLPGGHLVGSGPGQGEAYLGVMRDLLPPDVRVFWTGDGGVFSARVTTTGARAYADAIGHELGLWDNDAITFSRARRPCSGRDPDLASVVRTYMGNLAGEANWTETNGEFALLTSLRYAWNAPGYEPSAAAAAAERVLGVRPSAIP